MMKCAATTKRGAACGAPVVNDTEFCVFHTKGNPQALGAAGGARRAIAAGLKELAAPQTAEQVTQFLSQVLVEARQGLIENRKANAIVIVAGALLKSFEVAKSTKRTFEDMVDEAFMGGKKNGPVPKTPTANPT